MALEKTCISFNIPFTGLTDDYNNIISYMGPSWAAKTAIQKEGTGGLEQEPDSIGHIYNKTILFMSFHILNNILS
jgi:hypothetical protein